MKNEERKEGEARAKRDCTEVKAMMIRKKKRRKSVGERIVRV